ncbi:bifunctional homocysteine S-methyltransferase/methylenetetrahydrofolate reductase [Streptococcus oriscaviae]|uniref:Bifunctional homocysteine S-methyltransferase/methylenetetrahydrofolate reductase n=1 Tax=Streptococcus oriscaviae TaxID=2781599 RepID=A0ABX7YJN7_9STRE|nr:bifunctional homocysteine S-methyltransferase/methylenetetrahydrofolate reductase [Streptococcus oriscaviae]QUE53915.1 bifunctional homocysteine S-methyltransferase/methylenetetrahydrofolate reductase [Streptococcus oriscaviae]HEL1008731.1 bifunctional homocysteine S-methyltransferase/methylenetetrahydrofolate reductase [Streptococcus equi subsp. zooepidemicus]
MSDLLEKLKNKVLVADGAMGTLLYSYGLDTCHEAYNLTHPEQILAIHEAYIKAGADIIQTNTYGAQRHRLTEYGYDNDIVTINQKAVDLARQAAGDKVFVLGTIGASRGRKRCPLDLEQILEETKEQVQALLSTEKLDGLLFETYYDSEELLAVLDMVRPLTNLPILTNIALHEPGITENGRPLVELMSQLVMKGADIVGLNCHFGPYHMIQSLKQVPLFAQSYLAVYPNASLLAIDAETQQYQFSSNASYFGKSAELLVAEGVRVIGGCCGTTPEHIHEVKKAVKNLKPIARKLITPTVTEEDLIKRVRQEETLVDKVKKEVTIITELDPPKTLDIAKFQEAIQALDKKDIGAITLADNSLANTRICNLSIASYLKDSIQTPLLLHLTGRDHNLIGLQSRLMGLDLLGFHNILAITGDPSTIGDFPGATSVYDVNSFKLLTLIKQLNQGQSYSGASLRQQTDFTVAAAYNPNVKNIDRTTRLIEKKIAAGADYFITQPIFDASKFEQLAKVIQPYDTPFFVGIMPITSYNNAVFLHNEVPGIQLSESFLAQLEDLKDDPIACQAFAMKSTKDLIDQALKYFKGIYLITPFMRYDLTCQLIDYIKEKQLR